MPTSLGQVGRTPVMTLITNIVIQLRFQNTFDVQYILFVFQCLAIIGASFLQVGIGAELICPTVIIGALPGHEGNDEKEQLTMTTEQASWFGQYISTLPFNILLFTDRVMILRYKYIFRLKAQPGIIPGIDFTRIFIFIFSEKLFRIAEFH